MRVNFCRETVGSQFLPRGIKMSRRALWERKRALPRKNCKQPGLKQPGLRTPNIGKRIITVHKLFRGNAYGLHSDILFPYRSPSPRPHPDPTQHPETDPGGRPKTDPKRTRNGPKRTRNGPKSSSLGWDGRGVCRDGEGWGWGGKGKESH